MDSFASLAMGEAKGFFFDKQKVASLIDSDTRKYMNRVGGFMRLTIRRSMRDHKGTAPIGSAPFAHTRRIKETVVYGLDPARLSMVVGPTKLNAKNTGILPLLEDGGEAERLLGDHLEQTTRGLVWTDLKPRMAKYGARPFIAPAAEKVKPRLAGFWQK
jgi:hypothetical protein